MRWATANRAAPYRCVPIQYIEHVPPECRAQIVQSAQTSAPVGHQYANGGGLSSGGLW